MWRAQAGSNVQIQADEDDDWETDPDFVVSFKLPDSLRWNLIMLTTLKRMANILD